MLRRHFSLLQVVNGETKHPFSGTHRLSIRIQPEVICAEDNALQQARNRRSRCTFDLSWHWIFYIPFEMEIGMEVEFW
jgi:hypothetical protein